MAQIEVAENQVVGGASATASPAGGGGALELQGLDEANPLAGSVRDFAGGAEIHPALRADRFHRWAVARIRMGGYPYAKTLMGAPMAVTSLAMMDGSIYQGLNFSSQDYLSLSTHPTVLGAVLEAMHKFGVHSAGSTALAGNCGLAPALEADLADHLHMNHVCLFPTGWAAGYGVIAGLMRPDDHVVIDQLAHNCLQQGAAAATRNVHLYRHLDVEHLSRVLARIRRRDAVNSVMVVTEGVFSMDSDSPDLAAIQTVASEYNAILLVDVAHDLGCLGGYGGGTLELQGMLGKVDLVMGSFSKTFASNGGFVASTNPAIKEYLRFYAPPNTFSNALSPLQLAAIHASLRIVRSTEGAFRREKLMHAITALRAGLTIRQFKVLGEPSPIVPVMVGHDALARLTVREITHRGVAVNLVEYPAVSTNTSRLRLQVMADHTAEQCLDAAHRIKGAFDAASVEWNDARR